MSLGLQAQVAIVGGGIVGLSAALELRAAGLEVTVLERGGMLGEASWAAAGMLAAEDPANPRALLPLARFSLQLYRGYLDHIEERSGRRVPLRTSYTLQGEPDPEAGERPPVQLPTLRTAGWRFEVLEEASLDPRDLCAALQEAARAAGVELCPNTAVEEVLPTDREVALRLASGERLQAEHCIVAAGAWSGELRLHGFAPLPVTPYKGQMLAVEVVDAELPAVVRTPEVYLVPRGNGRILVGASVESCGFDRRVDQSTAGRLLHTAASLWPPIATGRIVEHWSGLRPGCADGTDCLPCIGQLGERLWVATRHFRNGILLAPGTAALLRAYLTGEPQQAWASAYHPTQQMLGSILHRE